MLKKLFMAGAALIFLSSTAFATASVTITPAPECVTPSKLIQMYEEANPELVGHYKVVSITEPLVITNFIEAITKVFGPPPQIEKIVRIEIERPDDVAKYNHRIDFYDKNNCKIAGAFVSNSVMLQILREAALSNGEDS